MIDKIKWLGRYLGCDVLDEDGKIQKITLGCYGRFDEIVLVLKELKDISDEDAVDCMNLHYDGWLKPKIIERSNSHFAFEFQYSSSNRRRVGKLQTWGVDKFNIAQVDFLRSKGYAIGIPKEYYITESELKEAE